MQQYSHYDQKNRSHEFVVCQKERKNPVILSEFTGSAQSLVGAILVNPHDTSGVAAAINTALTSTAFFSVSLSLIFSLVVAVKLTLLSSHTVSQKDKELKHEYNLSFILQNTSKNWGKLFLHDLAEIELCDNVPRLHLDEIISAYKKTKSR